jgi:UDP-4-amino-4,6-dideoxy-N-acetyl-beta-L-altrosamine transaminase
MMNYIPYGYHSVEQNDIDSVIEVLKSSRLTQGPVVEVFEACVSDYCQVEYAVAVCNATVALHLACKALDVGPRDRVWTSPNTFVASANCAIYCGAIIDFVDVCSDTYNLSVHALQEKLIDARKNGTLPKVVIPVHFAGQSCDMKAIKDLADEYGFGIIEDASHAIGARYKNKPVGSCQYSDITVFSFHPVKIITMGEGGVCLTNRSDLADRIKIHRSHGITRNASLMTKPPEGDWYYQQLFLGFNYRITDIQCALGVSQMQKLNDFVVKRHQRVKRYQHALMGLHLKLPTEREDCYSACHLYVIQILPHSNKSRKEVFDYLRSHNVGVNVHYIPVHLQPYYTQLGFQSGDFPIAEAYYNQAITLPLYPGLTETQQDYVVNKLREALDV